MSELQLSIIVPIYNVEEYLRECLESIYKVKNIAKEIILVNDGSIDNSFEIIKEYKDKYSSITTVIDKKNGGLSDARNSGMKIAKGKYIFFIDSDDLISPLVFEEIFKEGYKQDVDIIKANGYFLKENKENEVLNEVKIKDGIYKGIDLLEESYMKKIIRVEVWLSIYKNIFLKENNFYFYKGLIYEDTIFSYNVWIKSEKILFLNKNFYYYRIREGSIMADETAEKYIHKLKNAKLMLELKKEKSLKLKSIDWFIVDVICTGIIKYGIYDEELFYKFKKIDFKGSWKIKIKKIIAQLKKINCKKIEV